MNTRELLRKAKNSNYRPHSLTVDIEGQSTQVEVLLKKVTLQDLLKYTNQVPHLYNLLTGIEEGGKVSPQEKLDEIVGMLDVMKTLIVVATLDPETKANVFALEDSEEAISPDILGIEGINALGMEILSFSGFRS